MIMIKRFCFIGIILALTIGTAMAQDAKSFLQSAARAMGVDEERTTMQYSGTGWAGAVGQNYTPDMDWPRFDLTSYTRTIDFESLSSTEEMVLVQGDHEQRGGGGT